MQYHTNKVHPPPPKKKEKTSGDLLQNPPLRRPSIRGALALHCGVPFWSVQALDLMDGTPQRAATVGAGGSWSVGEIPKAIFGGEEGILGIDLGVGHGAMLR